MNLILALFAVAWELPSLDDLLLFPSHQYADEIHEFCQVYTSSCKLRLAFYTPLDYTEYREQLGDAEWREACWYGLYLASMPSEGHNLGKNLYRLRFLLGDDLYYSGRMPAPIPIPGYP